MIGDVYFDTNFFISTFEAGDMLASFGWPILQAVESGRIRGVTSELTLAELLPRPMAQADQPLVSAYISLIADSQSFVVVSVSQTILIAAAHLRSERMSLKLPDAIHIATAIAAHCRSFVTDDLRLVLPPTLRRIRLTADTLNEIGALG